MFLRKTADLLELVASKIVGTIFWPPTSVAVLVEKDGKILTLRVGEQHRLPGGLIKPGEDPRKTGVREIKEETGFDIDLGDLLDIKTAEKGNKGLHFFFKGEIIGGEKNGSWEGEVEFVPREEMKEKAWKLEHSHVHEYLFPEEE